MLIGYTPGAANFDYMNLPPVYYRDHNPSNAHGLFHSETLIEVTAYLFHFLSIANMKC